ncbi:S26 family signal peptidase [Spirillospora sp. NPDC048911]|uniref:S26 family signal peptidase n=1 Tax=Spirillospora sp. NPDC048911 TaxID=3364527 RepID=UPI003723F6E2
MTSGLVLARRRFVVVRVVGTSMEPAYRAGDRVLVRRRDGERAGRGQVVALQTALPGGVWRTTPLPEPAAAMWFLKRVVAVPGDPVPGAVAERVGAEPGAVVPEGHLVVLGDGPVSEDSRVWGHVPVDRVLGVVVRKLSPVAERGIIAP